MGLWNFVKSAGGALVGRTDASEAPSAQTLTQKIKDIGLDTNGAEIRVTCDTVSVTGGDLFRKHPENIYDAQVLRIAQD